MMPILVQKFGGTSVATPELREKVARRIIAAKEQGYQVVVVVSAIGRQGAPYATDTLLKLLRETFPGANNREQDLLLACGEIISGVLLTATLQRLGFKATCLSGAQAGIITDPNFGEAHINRVQPSKIVQLMDAGIIPVVAGFQGSTEDGEITTLGRGGSDTTAAALGVALNAAEVEIYTDVEGVKTADPRIVADARTLDAIGYNEICQLAHEGARVIHPRAVEIAMQRNIPLRVRSTFGNGPGTLIRSGHVGDTLIERDQVVTGITYVCPVSQITITELASAQQILHVFQSLAQSGISVDFINVFPSHASFTVRHDQTSQATDILEAMQIQFQVWTDCAKVAVVGAGMTGIPGVMASILAALESESIQVLQTADSYTSIWCLVKQADMEKAVRRLHQHFCGSPIVPEVPTDWAAASCQQLQ